MSKRQKERYSALEAQVFELKTEGFVCQSPVNGGNSIAGWGNGGTTNDDIYM